MQKSQIKPKVSRGFTLIEIMVVVVILGILGALIVPNIVGRPDEARVTAAKSDLQQIGNALDLYRMDNGHYPSKGCRCQNYNLCKPAKR